MCFAHYESYSIAKQTQNDCVSANKKKHNNVRLCECELNKKIADS